jgi:succinyl-diaminopimelate desuccinylase
LTFRPVLPYHSPNLEGTLWQNDIWQRITERVGELRADMVRMQTELTARPALGPSNGGIGEIEKCAYLKTQLEELGVQATEHRAPDERVPCGYRPSLIGFLPGRNPNRTIWVMTHVDVVPPGPRELWTNDPYQVVERDGKLYGRGVEDNQQEMVSSYFAVRTMLDLKLEPVWNVGLVFVADEETGSKYGIDYVLKNDTRFRKDDLVLVPDAGNEQGSHIEVAEKSIAWLKFTTIGRQTHGSTPNHGRNALRAGARLLLHMDKWLHERCPAEDPLFSPPFSTAEPTKKENNVPNINTIPGEDIFYFDCRVLPQYSIHQLYELAKAEAQRFGDDLGVQVKVATEQIEQAAPPTSADAPVVKALSLAVRDVYGVATKAIGIGGGTVAAFFRRAGIPAAVWGRFSGCAHQPDEYCIIANMVTDARIYCHIFGQEL